jgi:hypothetical protein
MIAWLLKNWKLFLDIVIVVAGIVLFTLFDPFGVFSNRSLKSTANILSSVKSIGELVTAEYYGEVISSLHGTQVYDLKPDTLNSIFESCFIELKSLIVEDVLEQLGDKSRLKSSEKRALEKNVSKDNYFKEIRQEYAKNNIYNHLIVFLGVNNIKNDKSLFYKKASNSQLRNKAESRVAEYLLKESLQRLETLIQGGKEITNAEFTDYIYARPPYFAAIVDYHYELNDDGIQKPKNDIVFIGRGWVKAGFQFGKLDKSNFHYDNERKIINFYGLSPVVLDTDINPWFIPEKKIKGFELVDFYKKATFEEAKAVKIRCKQELLEQAHNAEIMEQAQTNGEESLQNFFVLLTNEPNLKVNFYDLPYQKELNMIAADTLITVREALLIDTILSKETEHINKVISPEREQSQMQLDIFINQLKKLSFVKKDVPFNLFMLEAAKILEHKQFITLSDSATISKLRAPIRIADSLDAKILTTSFIQSVDYYSAYPQFVHEFNSMLNVLEDETKEIDAFRENTHSISQQELLALNLNPQYFKFDTVWFNNEPDSASHIVVTLKQKQRTFNFTDFQYPVLEVPETAYNIFKLADTSKVDCLLDSLELTRNIFTGAAYYDSLRLEDLTNIKHYESDRIKHEIKTRPVRRFTSTIQKVFGKN